MYYFTYGLPMDIDITNNNANNQQQQQQNNDWNYENKIIHKCNYRRRTWIRCAIYDISPNYNNKNDKKDEIKDEISITETTVPELSKSDSLSQSILRTKIKANDLLAMIDSVLNDENINDINIESENEFENENNNNNKKIAEYILSEMLNALLWHIHLCSQPNVIDSLNNNNTENNRNKYGGNYILLIMFV